MIRHLTWDSQCFGIKVGAVSLDPVSENTVDLVIEQARREGYRVLYIFSSEGLPEANRKLETAGAMLADRKVTFFQPVLPPTGHIISQIDVFRQPRPTPELYALALESGRHSRFALDPDFKPADFRKLYEAWIEGSVAKRLAREVLVYTENDETLGLLTLGEKNGRAFIGLLAVAAKARGEQIGNKLITAALELAGQWGLQHLQVVTQGANTAACRFYERNGFRLEKTELVYHYWLS